MENPKTDALVQMQLLVSLVQPHKKSEIKLEEIIKAARSNPQLEAMIEDSI